MQQQGIDVINLGIGSPDLPPHPDVIYELNKSSQSTDSNMYQSYRGIDELRTAIGNWYQKIYHVYLDTNTEVLPLMGSKEGIMHISMAFCDPGDQVLLPNPGYPAYTLVSKLLNLDIQYYNLNEQNNWLPSLNELESISNDRCKMIWINYPHMPTGKVADAGTLRELVMWAKYRDILVINDNPYSLILNKNPLSILSNLKDYKHVLELNSLSKSYNMAGWRIGMVGGSKENINHILKIKSNFDSGMYKAIQMAAAKALNLGSDWIFELNNEYEKRREIIWYILDTLNCIYQKETSGLFVWAKIPGTFNNSFEFSDYLLHTLCLFATPGSIFGNNGNQYIRFSLCANQKTLLKALNRVKTFKEQTICE